MSDEKEETKRTLTLVVVILMVLAVSTVTGLFFVDEHPYYTNRPTVKAGQVFLESARISTLSDAEIDQAIALLSTRETTARLSAYSILQREASRSPERKSKVISQLNRHLRSPDVTLAKLYTTVLKRLQVNPSINNLTTKASPCDPLCL